MRGDPRSASRTGRLILFALVSVSLLCPSIGAAQSVTHKTVLVLHTYGSQSAFRPLFDRVLQQTLNHNGFEDAEVYMETLEANRFSGSKHAAVFQYYLGQKYAGLKIDLVITVWNPALNYALEHRQELFPNAPILAVVTRPRTFASDANIAQVTAGDHFLDTANLALKLHPNTRTIAVVNGSLQSNDDVQAEIIGGHEDTGRADVRCRSAPRRCGDDETLDRAFALARR